ncbi:hypothetical protein SOVF_140700 [Spinacia oleracea]|nr:hypothetical protein SOVF_140700 [Spinacia oleracea]
MASEKDQPIYNGDDFDDDDDSEPLNGGVRDDGKRKRSVAFFNEFAEFKQVAMK